MPRRLKTPALPAELAPGFQKAKKKPPLEKRLFFLTLFAVILGALGLYFWIEHHADTHPAVRAVWAAQVTVDQRGDLPGRAPRNVPTIDPPPLDDPQEPVLDSNPEDEINLLVEADPADESSDNEPAQQDVDPVNYEPSREELLSAPLPIVSENGPYGLLPRIGPDGERPWQLYRRPPPELSAEQETQNIARIALIVTDLGISENGTEQAIQALPADISLALSPYGREVEQWAQKARMDGHEILLSIPMEPPDTFPLWDPGPHSLMSNVSASENIDRLRWILAQTSGYVGVINVMGAPFLSRTNKVTPVFDWLSQRGIFFVFDPSAQAVPVDELRTISAAFSLPFLEAKKIIDEVPTPAAIDFALQDLERLAYQEGAAIGILRPYPVSLGQIVEWLDSLDGKGIVVVPVSSLLLD